MAINEKIVNAMTDLDEDLLYAEVKAAVESGEDKLEIIAALQQGMTNVGDMFAKKEYFLSELMLSAEIFAECKNILGGEDLAAATNGAFVIGTVYGDIHDIGKSIVAAVMGSNGFKVIDLGVDVKPEAFIAAIKENDPKVIGMSCLLTTAFDAMKDCVSQIRAAGLDKGRLLLIGGGPVEVGTLKYVGADDFCPTVQDTVQKAKAFVGVR